MPQAISNLPVGSLVKDLNSKYLGAAIVWKIADHNHAGYPAGSTTLISDKILTSHLFDAKEVNNSDSNRRQYGNNRYKFSNIRQWLNKSSLPWYIAQHSADAPPTNENGYYPAFGYEEEAGFLSNLSADFINNILETTYSVALASVDGGGTENLTDKIFLASVDEANLGSGGSFPVFTDNTSRIGYYTAEGVAYHNKEISDHSLSLSPITTTTARYWWLRDAYASYSYSARNVSASGALSGSNALSGSYGVRPLCNLNSSILVSSTPDADGVYNIEFAVDTAPHISGADSDQGNIYGGFEYEYSIADNSETDTITVVEKMDGVIQRSYTATVGVTNEFELSQAGWLALSYGGHTATITATDSEGQSDTRTILFNKNQAAPTITGTDGSLGDIVNSLEYDYTVDGLNGVDGDIVTVVETLNGTQQRSYTATLGVQTAFIITEQDWDDVPFGNNTIVITATDSYGLAVSRTLSFVKRNYKPAISGSNTDLGIKDNGFSYEYTVYDDNFEDGDTVTVVEKLDGLTRKSYTLTAEATERFIISGELFIMLGNASHTMEITATDSEGETTSRIVTFTKQQDISLELEEALRSDGDTTERPVEATLLIDVIIPTGAIFSCEICNNGFDTSPTWEDCTIEARNGQTFIFNNENKTAEIWGVNIRVKILKNTATSTPILRQIRLTFKY